MLYNSLKCLKKIWSTQRITFIECINHNCRQWAICCQGDDKVDALFQTWSCACESLFFSFGIFLPYWLQYWAAVLMAGHLSNKAGKYSGWIRALLLRGISRAIEVDWPWVSTAMKVFEELLEYYRSAENIN